MVVEIMDTTLRDGEQTSGVSFARQEKLSIARLLLEDLKIPRIEIASARVSTGEYEMAKQLCEWAEKRDTSTKSRYWDFSIKELLSNGFVLVEPK